MRLPILLAFLAATPALASSDEAWQEFRKEVETACAALAPDEGETAIEVNPFGSESYGVALLITVMPDESVDRYVCVFDKESRKAELSAAFTPPAEVSETMTDEDGNVVNETTSKTDAHLIEK